MKKENYIEYFITKKRQSVESYVTLKEDAPESLKEFVRDIHSEFNALPDDYIYRIINLAFDLYDEYSDKDEFVYSEDGLDFYNNDILKWLEVPGATYCVDEAMENDYKYTTFAELVRAGQAFMLRKIKSMVKDFIESE